MKSSFHKNHDLLMSEFNKQSSSKSLRNDKLLINVMYPNDFIKKTILHVIIAAKWNKNMNQYGLKFLKVRFSECNDIIILWVNWKHV